MEILGYALALISAIVIAAITQIIGYYFSKKSLEAQQEHGLRVVKMQLYHEDRKKALIELDELLKTSHKTFDDFKKAAIAFLDGKQGLFLPRELRKELRGEVLELDGFLFNRLVELGHYQEPLEGYLEEAAIAEAAWAEAYPEQALDAEVRERLIGLKSSMRDRIKKYISEE